MAGYFVLEVESVENLCERTSVCSLLPSLAEKGDEIVPRLHAAALCKREGCEEVRILTIVSEGFDEVFKLNLKHNVHTALEVKSEVDILNFYVFVGVIQVHFFS